MFKSEAHYHVQHYFQFHGNSAIFGNIANKLFNFEILIISIIISIVFIFNKNKVNHQINDLLKEQRRRMNKVSDKTAKLQFNCLRP